MGSGEEIGQAFPDDCPESTRRWLTRLADGYMQFIKSPDNAFMAYSAMCKVGDDPTNPKSGWALRFGEVPSERVGGHRDGERFGRGFDLCLTGFIRWLEDKGYTDLHVNIDMSAHREDGVAVPHVLLSGRTKSRRPFAIITYLCPHPDIPPYFQVSENGEVKVIEKPDATK